MVAVPGHHRDGRAGRGGADGEKSCGVVGGGGPFDAAVPKVGSTCSSARSGSRGHTSGRVIVLPTKGRIARVSGVHGHAGVRPRQVSGRVVAPPGDRGHHGAARLRAGSGSARGLAVEYLHSTSRSLTPIPKRGHQFHQVSPDRSGPARAGARRPPPPLLFSPDRG